MQAQENQGLPSKTLPSILARLQSLPPAQPMDCSQGAPLLEQLPRNLVLELQHQLRPAMQPELAQLPRLLQMMCQPQHQVLLCLLRQLR